MKPSHLLVIALLLVAACGGASEGAGPGPAEPDRPLLQVRSEGGFVPVEWIYGRGPSYTLTSAGRLVYEGPVIAIYPGPLLPNYQEVTLDLDQVEEILDLVEEIGLPGMEYEIDDSASNWVADASTEVVTYWDESGEHNYEVYALGLGTDSPRPATAATLRLVEQLSAATDGPAQEYRGERVRIVAGVSESNPEPGLEDVRPWPLGDEDPTQWQRLDLGFTCKVFPTEVLETFRDATLVTRWERSAEPGSQYVLLVRPLHPAEPDCPAPA